jgi:Trypsin-like peptidase domain
MSRTPSLRGGPVLVIVIVLLWCSEAADSMSELAPPPEIVGAICRPEFQTANDKFEAGTAFMARAFSGSSWRPVLVTAHHLFGPSGGLPRQIRWNELPSVVRSVRCTSFMSERDTRSGPPLRVQDARPFSEEGFPRDVAVFALPDGSDRALQFSTGVPVSGQRVWLVARVAGGEPPTKLLHRASLVKADKTWIRFQYDNSKLELRATSGAPVVDERGRVIGINLGGGRDGNKLFGVAQSAQVILAALESALAAPAGPR